MQRKRPVPLGDGAFLGLANATLRRGKLVVCQAYDWTWRWGEQWALLGPDGAGKTLLVEALLGLVPLARGELHGPQAGPRDWGDEPAEVYARVSPLTQRQVAVEESSFYQSRWHSGLSEGQRTVAQFLSQSCVEEHNPFEVEGLRGDPRCFRRRQREWVRWFGIQPLLSRKLVHLSHGELRKTLLVRALLKAPRLLVLEDPFAGLDPPTRRVLHRVIERVMRGGLPVLVSTDRVEDLPAATTHLLLVDRRRVVVQGPKDEVLRLWRERGGDPAVRPRVPGCEPSDAGTGPAVSRRPRLVAKGQARKTQADCRHAAGTDGPVRRRSPGAPLVELRRVNVTTGRRRLLRDVTWTVREGECWALRGANGAGKTTLLNLIQGDHPQAYAQGLRLFGHGLDTTQTVWMMRQRLGWMSPELHQHYPGEWTAWDVVCSGYFNTVGLYQACSRAQRRAARRWLADLGLAAHAADAFGGLSFGQQRLVLLARAVVKNPRLLILDEPCQGLDAGQRHTLLATVDAVVARTRCSLIFVTHRAGETPQCITHRLRLVAGRVKGGAPTRAAAE